jgi:hypothetical protein
LVQWTKGVELRGGQNGRRGCRLTFCETYGWRAWGTGRFRCNV